MPHAEVKTTVNWIPRRVPLSARAVVAQSDYSPLHLCRMLALRDEQSLIDLSFVTTANKDLLVILGREHELPWADGVIYLGLEHESRLYLPTTMMPSVPVHIFEKAICLQMPKLQPPIAVIPTELGSSVAPVRLISLQDAQPLTASALKKMLGAPE